MQPCPGFIASLTNKCYFKIDSTHCPMAYQPYFMTFGNSELRVKIPGRKLFSNMGVVNKFFECKEKDPSVLLGSKERESETDHYEIHKVYFDDWINELHWICKIMVLGDILLTISIKNKQRPLSIFLYVIVVYTIVVFRCIHQLIICEHFLIC